MDHLNTWIKSRYTYCQKKYRKSGKRHEMEQALAPVRLVEQMFRSLPQDSVANAALNSKSFARALLNYEKILFTLRPRTDLLQLQPYYEKLHHIYAELNEPDGMVGVSASILSPSLQHQIREHEMTGRWTSAQSCWEVQLQLEPDSPESHIGLLRCLRNLGHYGAYFRYALA
jgi:serine/threonine-protein kinase ATR